MAPWVYDPHSGGNKIPPKLQAKLRTQVAGYSCERPWHKTHKLELRFKSQFCYIDTIEAGDARKFPLCRLRHFSEDNFSLALFTYSRERYENCFFPNGRETGRVIEALRICEPFIC